MKKVYVVVCYYYSASGDIRFGDVRIFDSLDKANHFGTQVFQCDGNAYFYAEVKEREVE